MQTYLAFVQKEFYHILRDWRTLLIIVGMPIVQMIIFGYVLRSDVENVGLAYINQSDGPKSRILLNRFEADKTFFMRYPLQSTEATDIEKAFKSGEVRAAIIIPPKFDDNLSGNQTSPASFQVIIDQSDPNTANIIEGYVGAITQELNAGWNAPYLNGKGFQPEVRYFFNENLKSSFMFVPGIMALILTIVSSLMTAVSLSREKEFGNMEILLVSPLRPKTIIFGKLTPYFFISGFIAILIIALGGLFFDLPIRGNYILLIAELTLFILIVLALGILISISSGSQQEAMMKSLFVLLLPTILLSGFIFPIRNMPWALEYFSYLLPPKYFLDIIRSIMIRGSGIEDVWVDSVVLIGFLFIFSGIAIKKFKDRLN